MTIDLANPDAYTDEVPHAELARLRRDDPVHWNQSADGSGAWFILKHADVVHVAKHPEVFSASEGGVVLEDLDEHSLAMMRNMLLAMDPPRHTDYRRPLAAHFKARVMAAMEDRVRAITRDILREVPADGEVEFVHDVVAHLPSRVVGELMGLPEEDWGKIHRWAERNTSGQDPELRGEEDDSGTNPSVEMAMYFIEHAARRRAEEPRPDLTSVILGTEFASGPMTDIDFGTFLVQLVTAGNDTTKTMLSSGLLLLLEHPEQLEALRRDRALIPSALEEILRFGNPLHYFRRTAVADTELRGTPIPAGDKVIMMYTSANRDEDVFDQPDRFDIRRDPNPHLSFGIAEHFCLGVHLARLEGRVFLEELLAAFARIELAGTPVRTRSNLNNAFKRLPVRLSR